MGDIADWTNDTMQEAYPDWMPVGSRTPRPPHCNRCGSTDVRWRIQTGKWTLFALEPGKLHVCELDDSAFGVVPE